MSRLALLIISAGIAAAPAEAGAQLVISVRAGMHQARVIRSDRFLAQLPHGLRMETGQGNAAALAVEMGRWLGAGRWGIFGELVGARNTKWRGWTPLPIPDFHTNTVFANLRLAFRTGSLRPVAVELFGGPSVVGHGGTGQSELTRVLDPGVHAGIRTRIRPVRWASLDLGVQQTSYLTTYARPWIASYTGVLGSFEATLPAGAAVRNEVSWLAGLTLAWAGRR